MISDTLSDAGSAIRQYQQEWASDYAHMKPQLDALRAQMIVLQMQLDCPYPVEWLEKNPIYKAAKAGDPSVSDRYMDGDDSVLDAFRAELKAAMGL